MEGCSGLKAQDMGNFSGRREKGKIEDYLYL
jgi:hypothetical protein